MAGLDSLRNQFNLTEEQKLKYEEKGRDFFSNFDFKEGKMISPLDLSANQIIGALKSGLPESELTDEEINILESVYGKEWKTQLE